VPEIRANGVHQHADDAAALIDVLAAAPAVVVGFVDEVLARP
jgi:hypothetical protein